MGNKNKQVGWDIGHYMFKPRLEGVIVPAEHAQALVEAYVEDEKLKAAKQKEKEKQAKAQKKAKKVAKEKAMEYVQAKFADSGATQSQDGMDVEVVEVKEEVKPAASEEEKKKKKRRKSSTGIAKSADKEKKAEVAKSPSGKVTAGEHAHEYPKELWKQLGGDQVEKKCKTCGHTIVQEVL